MARKSKNAKFELRDRTEPFDNNFADAPFAERRCGIIDRRKTNTYLSDDRRSGIAERRKYTDARRRMILTEDDIKRILR